MVSGKEGVIAEGEASGTPGAVDITCEGGCPPDDPDDLVCVKMWCFIKSMRSKSFC